MSGVSDLAGLLRHWDVEVALGSAVLAGPQGRALRVTAEDGRHFILKSRSGKLDDTLEVTVLSQLAAQGLPVAAPMPTPEGVCEVAWEESGYSLYPYLPGRVYDQHYTKRDSVTTAILIRAAAYGRGLARLHRGLATLSDRDGYSTIDVPGQLRRWVRSALPETAASEYGLDAVYTRFEPWLFARYDELPQQAIHRDAHPGNLLIQDGEVSGFIDWEISTRGPRLFDLAYCSTALLSAAGGIPARRQAWLKQLAALVAGYTEVQELTEAERALLGQMQMAIQLIFAAYHADAGRPEQMVSSLESLQWLVANRNAVSVAIGAVGRASEHWSRGCDVSQVRAGTGPAGTSFEEELI